MGCLGCKIKAALTLRACCYQTLPSCNCENECFLNFPTFASNRVWLGVSWGQSYHYMTLECLIAQVCGDSNSVQLGWGSGIVSHTLHHLNVQLGLGAIGVENRIPQLEGDCSSIISNIVIKKKKLTKTNLGKERGLFGLYMTVH